MIRRRAVESGDPSPNPGNGSMSLQGVDSEIRRVLRSTHHSGDSEARFLLADWLDSNKRGSNKLDIPHREWADYGLLHGSADLISRKQRDA